MHTAPFERHPRPQLHFPDGHGRHRRRDVLLQTRVSAFPEGTPRGLARLALRKEEVKKIFENRLLPSGMLYNFRRNMVHNFSALWPRHGEDYVSDQVRAF